MSTNIERNRLVLAALLGGLAVVLALVATGLFANPAESSTTRPELTKKPFPENDKKRGPKQDAGYFLGHPTPTYSWHGCTKTSSYKTPTVPPVQLPQVYKGSKQSKVRWTLKSSDAPSSKWILSWKAVKGWKICGVQVAARTTHKKVDTDLALQAGYTSGASKGTTVKSGAEKIKVKITKKDANMIGLEKKYAGKTMSIKDIYSVVVFIKKK